MQARIICLCVLLATSACSSPNAAHADAPDASDIPKSAAGIFEVTSSYELAQPPAGAAAVLAELRDATDDPDDPGRYLVDKTIDVLPDTQLRTYAREVEPLLAAYVQHELESIAPDLAPGLRSLARGFERDARQFSLHELWRIELGGTLTRVAPGAAFGTTNVAFAEAGLPDAAAQTHITLDAGGTLAVAHHGLALPYGALLRLALDRDVVPKVLPSAHDLPRALATLVDCKRLGDRLSSAVGVGAPSVYAAACDVALTEVAHRFYARLAEIDEMPVMIEQAGSARGVDRDGDGTMDAIVGGAWTGELATGEMHAPLGTAAFDGHR